VALTDAEKLGRYDVLEYVFTFWRRL
jgi:hypothetical protein